MHTHSIEDPCKVINQTQLNIRTVTSLKDEMYVSSSAPNASNECCHLSEWIYSGLHDKVYSRGGLT